MSILSTILGLSGDDPIPPEKIALLIERRSALARYEARLVALDLLGVQREELSDDLGLAPETINTYWKRVYQKTGQRTRPALRAWAEDLLVRELRSDT